MTMDQPAQLLLPRATAVRAKEPQHATWQPAMHLTAQRSAAASASSRSITTAPPHLLCMGAVVVRCMRVAACNLTVGRVDGRLATTLQLRLRHLSSPAAAAAAVSTYVQVSAPAMHAVLCTCWCVLACCSAGIHAHHAAHRTHTACNARCPLCCAALCGCTSYAVLPPPPVWRIMPHWHGAHWQRSHSGAPGVFMLLIGSTELSVERREQQQQA